MIDIKSYDYDELIEYIESLGEPSYRAKQIYEWLHVKHVTEYAQMTNIPKQLLKKLEEQTYLVALTKVEVQISQIDDTHKYLFELHDGNMIESVMMRYNHGISVCISSQVGCRMGCRFCASTIDGLERNLTPSEMLDQIYSIQRDLHERVSHIVVMGSGEPMDNYDNFVKFVHMISDEHGLNIGQRNITVSTCGIVPNMYKLADEGLAITLALSLHAPDDETRKTLMPIANSYKIEDILKACSYYFDKTGRRVTYEYSLVAGVNDNPTEAQKLIHLLKDMHGHVNLIPVNPIEERDFRQSATKAITEFKNLLEKNGINVTIRREMGRDIDGACGQLRRHYKDKKHKEEPDEGNRNN